MAKYLNSPFIKLPKHDKANGSLKINFCLGNGVSTKIKNYWVNENILRYLKEILRINARFLEWKC